MRYGEAQNCPSVDTTSTPSRIAATSTYRADLRPIGRTRVFWNATSCHTPFRLTATSGGDANAPVLHDQVGLVDLLDGIDAEHLANHDALRAAGALVDPDDTTVLRKGGIADATRSAADTTCGTRQEVTGMANNPSGKLKTWNEGAILGAGRQMGFGAVQSADGPVLSSMSCVSN
jgi:hypothetical protein